MPVASTSARVSHWLLPSIVLLGLGLRAYHFLRCPSVWHDEAALLINVLELNYSEQLGPLLWHEAAPPLFLWIERTLYLGFGDHIQLFRLLPFLASCATLLLLVPICRRLLPTSAVPWTLLLFACGEKFAWHACEAKPYAIDALVGAVLLYLFCTSALRSLNRQLCLFALLSPFLIFLSFPATFLLGGVLIALLPSVWRAGTRGTWLRYCLLGGFVVGSFALLALGPARAQRDGAMMSCWTHFFPDWSRPAGVPFWVVTATCEVFRYCLMPLGQPLAAVALVGIVVLWRGGQRSLLAFLLVPTLLALVASCFERYPYGGARVMLYTAPALVVLIGIGLPVSLAWLRQRSRPGFVAAVVLLLLPAGQSLRRVLAPWDRAEVAGASSFVLSHRQSGDAVLGNSWSHVYSLRTLQTQFQYFEGADAQPGRASRAWILYTSQIADTQRLEEALDSVPNGWQVLEHHEFRFTTVLLTAAPQAAH